LVFEDPRRTAKNEAECLDVLWQVLEFELDLLPSIEIVGLKGLKIGNQHIAGQLGVFDAGKLVERLLFGLRQIAACAFLLDEESPFPKKVDEAGRFGSSTLYRFFEGSNLAA